MRVAMNGVRLEEWSVLEMLALYSRVMEELRERKVVRSSNSIDHLHRMYV